MKPYSPPVVRREGSYVAFYDNLPKTGEIMFYPNKTGNALLVDMINAANNTNYVPADVTFGTPTTIVGQGVRNTRVPVSFNGGDLDRGALTHVDYRRLSMEVLFTDQDLRFVDEGYFDTRRDILARLQQQYGFVFNLNDVINTGLDLSLPSTNVEVAMNLDSLIYTGSVIVRIDKANINWSAPLTQYGVQSFEQATSPFAGDWIIDTQWQTDGTRSLRSAPITAGQTSSCSFQVAQGAFTELVFDYRTSTEENYDFLEVLFNGTVAWLTSGARSGRQQLFLPPGPVTVEFRYRKDATNNIGDDKVNIDRVRIRRVS